MTDDTDLDETVCPILEADDSVKLKELIDALGHTDLINDWLIFASSCGSTKCMRVLLESGGDVEYRRINGESAFSHACASNQLEAAKLLYMHGAKINENVSGGSPLDIVVCWASPEFRRWLKTDIPNQPENWQTDGRMYPPQEDQARTVDGRSDLIRYRSLGHNAFIRENGAIEIRDLSENVILSKPGKDGRGINDE